jgi:hypothetical protein
VPSDNDLNNALLAAELPNARLVDTAYIRWLYDESPYGPAVQRNADDEGQRVAHYGMIPQRYRGPDGVVPAGFSLNAVVKTGAQRKGWFRQSAPRSTKARSGVEVHHVCNEKSIGTVTASAGRPRAPAGARFVACSRGVESHASTTFFVGPLIGSYRGSTSRRSRGPTAHAGVPAVAARDSARVYAVHASNELVGVSTVLFRRPRGRDPGVVHAWAIGPCPLTPSWGRMPIPLPYGLRGLTHT